MQAYFKYLIINNEGKFLKERTTQRRLKVP